MRLSILRLCVAICVGFYIGSASASSEEDPNVSDRRAKFNYQMFCQGCHAADGVGHKSVPSLRDSMHQFMRFKEGRQFMVRVPGSANSVLSDAHLAEVLNWMVNEFSQHIVEKNWREYSTEEVQEYRQSPLLQTEKIRAQLVQRFSKK